MKIKQNSTATLESMVKWAVDREATSIFTACINKIKKQSEARGINPVVIVAYAAYHSNFGKYNSMCNESYCNLFNTIKETDDIISVKRYKNWNDCIKEFLDKLERTMFEQNVDTVEDLIEDSNCRDIITNIIRDINNTHVEPSTVRILTEEDENKDCQIKELNEMIMELQEIIDSKDDEIVMLKKANEDMKDEIRTVELFKNTLKDFLK